MRSLDPERGPRPRRLARLLRQALDAHPRICYAVTDPRHAGAAGEQRRRRSWAADISTHCADVPSSVQGLRGSRPAAIAARTRAAAADCSSGAVGAMRPARWPTLRCCANSIVDGQRTARIGGRLDARAPVVMTAKAASPPGARRQGDVPHRRVVESSPAATSSDEETMVLPSAPTRRGALVRSGQSPDDCSRGVSCDLTPDSRRSRSISEESSASVNSPVFVATIRPEAVMK